MEQKFSKCRVKWSIEGRKGTTVFKLSRQSPYLQKHNICNPNQSTGSGQNNGNTKKLRNRTCFCWLHWKNFNWQHWIFFRMFTNCSALASALVIVSRDSPCERIGKWETCPILKADRSFVRVNWRVCDKTATLLGVSRATISKFMLAYAINGKTTSAKGNNGRKSTLT
jgi:hypothetical protein